MGDFGIESDSEFQEIKIVLTHEFNQIIFGDCPCDKCEWEAECKRNCLACEDFVNYVETQKVRELDRVATRSIYVKLFNRDVKTQLSSQEIEEIRVLSRARGVTHKMISEEYFILPAHVKQLVGESDE